MEDIDVFDLALLFFWPKLESCVGGRLAKRSVQSSLDIKVGNKISRPDGDTRIAALASCSVGIRLDNSKAGFSPAPETTSL